jgi:hypothetical protein
MTFTYTSEQLKEWSTKVDPSVHALYARRGRYMDKEEWSLILHNYGESGLTVDQFCVVTKVPKDIFKASLMAVWKERVDDVNYIYIQIQNLCKHLEDVSRVANKLKKELEQSYAENSKREQTMTVTVEQFEKSLTDSTTALEVESEYLDRLGKDTKRNTRRRFRWS